jgi:Sulfotransferase family
LVAKEIDVSTLRHALQSNEILMFFHIPKTAGTSLAAILAKQFRPSAILQVAETQYPRVQKHLHRVAHRVMSKKEYLEIKNIPDYQLGHYKLIRGHLLFDPPIFQTRRMAYMTMLRHPIERLFSLYQHVHSIHDNSLYEEIKSLSFEAALELERFQIEARDQMTAYILRRKPVNQKDIEEAYTKLEQMHFIGITEYFETSMHLLHYTFGWKYHAQETRLNSSLIKVDRSQLSPQTYERLQDLTRFDQMFYDYGVRIFNERCRKMASELFIENIQFQQKVDQMMATNQQLKKDLTDQTRMRMRNYQFRADFNLNQDGDES